MNEVADSSKADAALATARAWAAHNSLDAERYTLEHLLATKDGVSIAVVIPARDVQDTIAGVVSPVAGLSAAGVVDELVVIDGASTDRTAELARQVGAKVLREDALMAELGPGLGKGDAMWRGLAATDAQIVVYLDADTVGFDDRFVRGLVGPLLERPQLQLVKASYGRPFTTETSRIPDGGGRVSELVARPLLNMHFPELTVLRQPLSGELAARRSALTAIPFATGYGIEIQMLIDIYRAHGVDAIAQVEVGERVNSHQHVSSLSRMAFTIMRTVAARSGATIAATDAFVQYVGGELAGSVDTLSERPPLRTIDRSGVAA